MYTNIFTYQKVNNMRLKNNNVLSRITRLTIEIKRIIVVKHKWYSNPQPVDTQFLIFIYCVENFFTISFVTLCR